MPEETDILQKLVVEDGDIRKEMEKMVEEAQKHFRIEKSSGKVIFQNFGDLNDKQRIATLLLGKYFAFQLKIIEYPLLSISDVAKELGRPVTTLSGNMKELVTKGYVEYVPNGKKYRISYHRMREIFDDLLIGKRKK